MQQQQQQQEAPREITGILIISIALLLGLGMTYVNGRRQEIMANWGTYRLDPFILFMAPFLKPDVDPRSRFQYASDNYNEVIKVFIDKVVSVALTPVYQIFGSLSDAISTAAGGLNAIKLLLSKMFKAFQSMVDIFMQRFGKIGRALIGTFRQIFQALQRVWGTAVSALYSGLSVAWAMKNAIQLMVTISIAILSILTVMMFWFFYALWPLMPLIVLGSMMVHELSPLVQAINGGDDGGAGDADSVGCFDPATRIARADGTDVALCDVKLGDRLRGGGSVDGILRFKLPTKLYSLYGVRVTGNHIVWSEETPVFVQDHPDSTPWGTVPEVICLLTSHRRIPVLTEQGVRHFADWEELDDGDEDALQAWYERVVRTLNPLDLRAPARRSDEEAGCSSDVPVHVGGGRLLPIKDVVPGMLVLDAEGRPTRVTGVVLMKGGAAAAVHRLSRGAVTTGSWRFKGGVWGQPEADERPAVEALWHHLFTDAGTFRVAAEGIAMRDFSDLGPDLSTTYETTLRCMEARQKTDALRKK